MMPQHNPHNTTTATTRPTALFDQIGTPPRHKCGTKRHVSGEPEAEELYSAPWLQYQLCFINYESQRWIPFASRTRTEAYPELKAT